MLQGRVVRTSSQLDDRGRDRELGIGGVEDVHVKPELGMLSESDAGSGHNLTDRLSVS